MSRGNSRPPPTPSDRPLPRHRRSTDGSDLDDRDHQCHRDGVRRRRVPRRGEPRGRAALSRQRREPVPQPREPARGRSCGGRIPARERAREAAHALSRRQAGQADRRRLPAGGRAWRRPRHARGPEIVARRDLFRDRRRGDARAEARAPRRARHAGRHPLHRRQLRERRIDRAAPDERLRSGAADLRDLGGQHDVPAARLRQGDPAAAQGQPKALPGVVRLLRPRHDRFAHRRAGPHPHGRELREHERTLDHRLRRYRRARRRDRTSA